MDTQEILNEYARYAKEHGEGLEFPGGGSKEDVKKMNSAADQLIRLRDILKSRNQLHELSRLLDNADNNVRCWAAADLLEVDAKKALRVLREIEKQPGLIGLNAEMAIKEYNKNIPKVKPSQLIDKK